MKRFLTILLFFSGAYSAFSQTSPKSEKDSIVEFFAKAKELRDSYELSESILLVNKVIELSIQSNDTYHLSMAYNLLGANYEELQKYVRAQKTYEKAIDYARLSGNDTLIGMAQNNLGNIFAVRFKNYSKSNNFYFKARQIALKHNDTSEILTSTMNLSWNYLETKQPERAFNKLNSAALYLKETSPNRHHFYLNFLLGTYYQKKKLYKTALEYYDKAINLGISLNMPDGIANTYFLKSEIYSITGEPDLAIDSQNRAKEYKNQFVNTVNTNFLEIQEGIADTNGFGGSASSFVDDRNYLEQTKSQFDTAGYFKENMHWFIYLLLLLLFSAIMWLTINRYKNAQNRLTEMLNTRNQHLKAAKEEAEKLSRLKSQFVSTVSHELRTPLYGVVGLTSLLLEENNLSAQENQYLKSLKFSGDYLLNLINDILNLSKIESNKVSFEKTPFNIRDLVQDVINSFKFQLDKKNNKIHVYIDKQIPEILKGDDVPLSQILINLIGNAVKFTSYGNIWIFLKLITIKDNVASVNFIVKDDGPGIPKEKHEEIFENFSQLDRDNNEYQGTGLGLSIVKKLIDLMNGEIKLTSSEGKGAAFNFNLDFDIASESSGQITNEKRMEKNALSGSIFGKGYKVLIVEDNKINQIVTKNILLKENFECEVVDNGLTAIEYVKRKKYDLILMDLNMPLMSGIDASIKIREFDKETPIVALTAVEIEDVKDDIDKAEINDIINKPFDKSEFYKIILRNISKNQTLA